MTVYWPNIPKWFNFNKYHERYQDVADDIYYGATPERAWEHYVDYGYAEARNIDFTVIKPPPKTFNGTLKLGKTFVVEVDGFDGEENDTKVLPNENSLYYIRSKNVRKAYKSGSFEYWYTSRDFGKGHVLIRPPFGVLGYGLYRITTKVRITKNRASYPCTYEIISKGKLIFTKNVSQKGSSSSYKTVDLGVHYMGKDSHVLMSDKTGTSSIMFGPMKFKKMSQITKPGDVPVKPYEPKTPPKPNIKYDKHVVMRIGQHGAMSMYETSNGDVLIGAYSGTKYSNLYSAGIKKPITSIETGESIIKIWEDPKTKIVYLAVEDYKVYADVLRTNPLNYNFKVVNTLFGGIHDGVFDVKRVRGKLVMLGGEIYTKNHNTRKILDHDYYCKNIFEYRGHAFIPGYSYVNDRAGFFVSRDALTWTWKNVGSKYNRFMNAVPAPDGSKFWLVGTKNYKDGHNKNSATIWQYNDNKLKHIRTFPGFDYISSIKYGPNGKIYFMLTVRWKGIPGGAQLIELNPINNKIKMIAQFPYSEGRELIFRGNDVWVAVRSQTRGGMVYKVINVL